MGATFWHHDVPWQPDLSAALRQLQADEFLARYDFRRELSRWRRDAEDVVRAEIESGDKFGLVGIYSRQLRTIIRIASRPIPSDPLEQIALMRRVLPDGFGGVLDVTGIGSGGTHVLHELTPAETLAWFGTERPDRATAHRNLLAVSTQLDRGASVAFCNYDEGSDLPTHWMFVGNTVD